MQRSVCAADSFSTTNTLDFFTTAADALLRSRFNSDTNCTITNLWIYNSTNPSVSYTPDIHRCLQVAVNLVNSMTNTGALDAPVIFRPMCRRDIGPHWTNLYITGYAPVTNDAWNLFAGGIKDLKDPTITSNDMIWGVPFVVGSRSDLPAFSECLVTNSIAVSRKLAFSKFPGGSIATNQSYFYSISNGISFEMKNYSTQALNRAITFLVTNQFLLAFTNEQSMRDLVAGIQTNHYDSACIQIASNQWLASGTRQVFATNLALLPWSQYLEEFGTFTPDETGTPQTNRFPVHDWVMCVTNRFCVAMIDSSTSRLLDFVNLGEVVISTNVNQALAVQFANVPPESNIWLTNGANHSPSSPPSQGLLNQIAISLGVVNPPWPVSPPELEHLIYSFRSWWTDPYQTTKKLGWFYPISVIPTHKLYSPPDRYTHYTLGDMIDPWRVRRFETNVWLVTEVDYPNQPVRVFTNTPALVVSNGFVSAYERDNLVLGPYLLPGAHPSPSLNVMSFGISNSFGFSWPTTVGQQYIVETATQLPEFGPCATIDASSTQSVFIVPISNSARYYRVRTDNW